MPYIHCDYSAKLVPEPVLGKLVQELLGATTKIYNLTGSEGKDKISIFTTPYGSVDHSTAAAEIEVRAKVAEFDRPGVSREEVRQGQMDQYKAVLDAFIAREKLAAGIVFTITFQDWAVVWLAPAV